MLARPAGKAPAPVESEAEKAYLAFLTLYFAAVLLLGLALAGSVRRAPCASTCLHVPNQQPMRMLSWR
jgi:hypothetical protein